MRKMVKWCNVTKWLLANTVKIIWMKQNSFKVVKLHNGCLWAPKLSHFLLFYTMVKFMHANMQRSTQSSTQRKTSLSEQSLRARPYKMAHLVNIDGGHDGEVFDLCGCCLIVWLETLAVTAPRLKGTIKSINANYSNEKMGKWASVVIKLCLTNLCLAKPWRKQAVWPDDLNKKSPDFIKKIAQNCAQPSMQ